MGRNVLEMFREGIPFFEMLKDEQRQEILYNLITRDSLTVTELTELSSLSRPAVSHHLKLLNQVDLVKFKKEGVKRIYSANVELFIPLLRELLKALEEDIQKSKKKIKDKLIR